MLNMGRYQISGLLVLVIGVIFFYFAGPNLVFPFSFDDKQNVATPDLTKQAVAIPENWQSFAHKKAGFLLRYPLDWEVNITSPDEFSLQPGGKRYFREPNNLYPLIVEVVEEDLAALQKRYPYSPILLNDQVKIGGDQAAILAAPIKLPLILKHTERQDVYVVFRSDIGLMSIAEAETESLRQIIMQIISGMEFFP